MSRAPDFANGLELILAEIQARYEIDARGGLVRAHNDGILPRFVLGRAAEGCLWRFRADLESVQVKAVAKLAGRELGFPTAGEIPVLPPDRLVMIQRLLASEGLEPEVRREVLTRKGVDIAELWTLD